MSKFTFTDEDDETFTATKDTSRVMGLSVGRTEVEFYASDAEAIVYIIRQASGYAPQPDEDACDQSDGEKSDPTIPDCPTTLAYRKVALDAALAWSSIPRREAPPSPEFVVKAAALFEGFLLRGEGSA